MIPEVLVATTNLHKLRELQVLLANAGVALRAASATRPLPVVNETGDTYFANAQLKAVAFARWADLPALADDSGLEVDALDGAPGVLSARYAGPDANDAANIDKLLRNLRGVAEARRTARFRCSIVVATPNGASITAEGSCEGVILNERCGNGGFGYDPVFYYPPAGCTFAELGAAQKNRVSHRAQACAALAPQLLPFVRTVHTAR